MNGDGQGSFSVAQIWRESEGNYHLIHLWRARVESRGLGLILRSLILNYGCGAVLIEGGGPADLLAERLQRIFGHSAPKVEIVPTCNRSKKERLNDVKDLIKDGRVWLPARADWVRIYLDEVEAFPNCDHNDQVDALSQALNWLRQGRPIPPPPLRSTGAIGRPGLRPFNPPGKGYVFVRQT